jgi:hypothetical protein
MEVTDLKAGEGAFCTKADTEGEEIAAMSAKVVIFTIMNYRERYSVEGAIEGGCPEVCMYVN